MSKAELLTELSRLRRQLQQRDESEQTQQRAVDVLRRSESRYRSLIESVPDIIFMVRPDGLIEYINAPTATWLGRPTAQIIGQSIRSLFPPIQADSMLENLRQVAQSGQPALHSNQRGAPGRERWLDTWLLPYRDADGRVTAVVGLSRDVTPLKEAQTQLRSAHEELELRVAQRTAQLEQEVTERQRAERWLRTERDLAVGLAAANDVAAAGACALDAAIRVTGIDGGGVYVAGAAQGGLLLVAHRGLSPEFIERVRVVPADSLRATRVSSGQPYYWKPADLGPNDPSASEGLRTAASLPFCYQGRVAGAMNLASRGLEAIELEDRQLIEAIARSLGAAIGRIQAEQALADNERLLQTLMDAIPLAVFYKDTSGRYLGCNTAFCQLTGRPREQIIGKTVQDIVPSPQANLDHEMDCRVLQDRQPAVYERVTSPLRYQVNHKAPFYNPDGQLAGLIATCTDISDRRHMENALRVQRDLMMSLSSISDLQAAARCILDTAIATGVVDGGGVYHVNGPAQELELIAHRGVTEAYAASKQRRTKEHPSWQAVAEGRVIFWSARTIPAQLAEPVKMRSAAILPVSHQGRIIAAVLLFSREHDDIPPAGQSLLEIIARSMGGAFARIEAENALRATEARSRALLEAVPDMKFRLDADGRFLEFIPGRINGPSLKPVDFIGRRLHDVLPRDVADRCLAAGRETLAAGTPTEIEYQLAVPLPDGPIRQWEARVVRCGDNEVIAVVRDITERKQTEWQLLEYQEQLRSLASELSLAEERERHRLAGELHDQIGQALALARIKLGAIQQKNPAQKESLADVGRLIEQTLQDTRSLTFQLSPPILYELGFEPAVEWQSERIRAEYGVAVDVCDDHQAKPLSDDVRIVLFQAVRELLVNAAKHARATTIRVVMSRQDRQVRIEVADNGVGFDATQVERGRSGFGLFSMRERLGHLGGSLEIQSTRDQGSRMTLRAPLRASAG